MMKIVNLIILVIRFAKVIEIFFLVYLECHFSCKTCNDITNNNCTSCSEKLSFNKN